MPLRVTFHPNRISITPHPTTKHFEDQFEQSTWMQSINSLRNLRVAGNPFLLSKATKRRMQDRIMAMYRLATPRTVVTTSNKLLDRKSTRLNSSHVAISYAVFCLK